MIEDITDQPYHVAAYNLVLAQSASRDICLLEPDNSLAGVVQPTDPANEPTEDI